MDRENIKKENAYVPHIFLGGPMAAIHVGPLLQPIVELAHSWQLVDQVQGGCADRTDGRRPSIKGRAAQYPGLVSKLQRS